MVKSRLIEDVIRRHDNFVCRWYVDPVGFRAVIVAY